ncbi:hypothetical protein [Nocardioides zeae]|uniref:Uncharacterized protein n=1 Tax=Nocardioides zeae TaxID=1457234 RepID=A0A6P0HLJ7_9ACTN|nr:hypothetical protein [Nocardioides zeae]NEN79127.1 hypothetical protein [Nocardioides zeae]
MTDRPHGRSGPRPRPRLRGRRGAPPAAALALLVGELWPDGTDGPLDEDALRRVAHDYARRGDDLRRLLHDLEQVVDLLGPAWTADEVSALVEQSALAWSDTFLGVRATGDPTGPSDATRRPRRAGTVEIVTVRLAGLHVARPDGAGAPAEDLRTVSLVAAEHLPGSEVLLVPAESVARVVVQTGGDATAAVATFAAACSELTTRRCTVTVERVAVGSAEHERLLGRSAG